MKFSFKKGKDKLHKQWVKHGALPSEAIPQKENHRGVPVGREKNGRVLRVLYISLGVSIVVFCVGSVFFFTRSC